MSSKTKIVVLHMKELIYTGIFAALGILLVILLIILFLPKREDTSPPANPSHHDTPTDRTVADTSASDITSVTSPAAYIPGIYTTELILNDQSVNIEVIVNHSEITSIRLVNLNDTVATMYPLLEPTLKDICTQVLDKQSLDGITYAAESKYTSLVLLEAIRNSLSKAIP